MEEQKINALINLGQSKIVEKAYDDIVSQPSKKMSTTLSTILDLGNTVLWPVKWFNERTRIFFENNIRKYEEKLKDIPDEKIVTVPTEISKPILDRLIYVSNEELQNAFINLLTCASSSDTIHLAHPGFISVIDRLSPDEAKILIYFKDNPVIPRLDIKCQNKNDDNFVFIRLNETGVENIITLTFPKNINIYLDNLVSLGIIISTDYFHTALLDRFEEIANSFVSDFNELKNEGDSEEDHLKRRILDKGMYRLTDFGNLFLESTIQLKNHG